MKILQFLKIRIGVLFAGVVMILSACALATDRFPVSSSLKDPPAIELQTCIQVQQAVSSNPLSPMPNDFLIITKYEEKSNEPGAMKKGLKPDSAFNMYLVLAFLAPPENQEVTITHGTVLIVKVITTQVVSSRETVHQWIFVDKDGDQNIDRAVFRETITEEAKEPVSKYEAKFPQDRLPEFQTYYEKAVLILSNKMEQGHEEGCLVS